MLTDLERTNAARVTAATNLAALAVALRSNVQDEHGEDGLDWADLPTFGGDKPTDTSCVWSWDAENVLVGTCHNDLRIVPRGLLTDLERTA